MIIDISQILAGLGMVITALVGLAFVPDVIKGEHWGPYVIVFSCYVGFVACASEIPSLVQWFNSIEVVL